MAKSKTGSFWLTETVTMPLGTLTEGRVQGTIDLGAYVDVGDQQAISIERVDFIWQRSSDYGNDLESFLAAVPGSLGVQVTDLNPGTLFVRGDDNSLIASGALNISSTSNASHSNDFYPDNFGKLDESRMVVNDSLYVVVGNDGANIGTAAMHCTARIKARIVKLGTKDWMSIAIQSTASDN
jgi:hypothetical protein